MLFIQTYLTSTGQATKQALEPTKRLVRASKSGHHRYTIRPDPLWFFSNFFTKENFEILWNCSNVDIPAHATTVSIVTFPGKQIHSFVNLKSGTRQIGVGGRSWKENPTGLPFNSSTSEPPPAAMEIRSLLRSDFSLAFSISTSWS